jgi:hypothetical protein
MNLPLNNESTGGTVQFYQMVVIVIHEALGSLVPTFIISAVLATIGMALGQTILPLHFLLVWGIMVLIQNNVESS